MSGLAGHRQRVLHALGITPWVYRQKVAIFPSQPLAIEPVSSVPLVPISSLECVVILPAGCTARELDLLGRAFYGFGVALARAPRIEVVAGQMIVPPLARSYLVIGQAQAQALGRQIAVAALQQTHIILIDVLPQAILTTSLGKRQLWTAMRNLRRALATYG